MRLQLIMSPAADVLHKSSPLHPGCFHGNGASNCGASAHSPTAPAKVDAGAGSPPVLPRSLRASAGPWEKTSRWRGGDPEMGSSDLFIPPPPPHLMVGCWGERRSFSEIWSPKMLNKWAGVSPKWERAAIGCCRPAVPMGARLAVGYPQHKQSYMLAPAARGRESRQRCVKEGVCSSHMATPRTDLVRELRRRPSAARAHCAFRKKQH